MDSTDKLFKKILTSSAAKCIGSRKTSEIKSFFIRECLVTRIILIATAGLTFCILDPYPSKDIGLDLSHVISH